MLQPGWYEERTSFRLRHWHLRIDIPQEYLCIKSTWLVMKNVFEVFGLEGINNIRTLWQQVVSTLQYLLSVLSLLLRYGNIWYVFKVHSQKIPRKPKDEISHGYQQDVLKQLSSIILWLFWVSIRFWVEFQKPSYQNSSHFYSLPDLLGLLL